MIDEFVHVSYDDKNRPTITFESNADFDLFQKMVQRSRQIPMCLMGKSYTSVYGVWNKSDGLRLESMLTEICNTIAMVKAKRV